MTNAQKLDLRSRAIKTRLNELSGVDELSPALRGEIEALTTELPDVELRYAAAITSEATDATGGGDCRARRRRREHRKTCATPSGEVGAFHQSKYRSTWRRPGLGRGRMRGGVRVLGACTA